MKNIVAISLCLILHLSYGQAEQLAEPMIRAALPETQSMRFTNRFAEEALDYQKDISKKLAAIVVLKGLEHNALQNTPENIEDTGTYQNAIRYIDEIIYINAETFQLVNANQDLNLLSIEMLTGITTKSYQLIEDFYAYIQGGNNNMMLPTDRYTLIKNVNLKLENLAKVSRALHSLIELHLQFANDLENEPLDISLLRIQTENEIQTIINN